MNVKFEHGASNESYEDQANRQGFTLGSKAKIFDRIAVCYIFLYEQGYLTDDQVKAIQNKIEKDLMKSLVPADNVLKELIDDLSE